MWKEYKKVLKLIDGKKMTASLCVNDIEKLFMKKLSWGALQETPVIKVGM